MIRHYHLGESISWCARACLHACVYKKIYRVIHLTKRNDV